MLQRILAHSTKLLRDTRVAMGKGNAPAPQAVRPLAPALPLAPIPPLDWRQISSSKCPGPPRRRMWLAKITMAAKRSEAGSFTGGAAAAEARVCTLGICRRSSAV
jgi:hypothetical protein